MIEDINVINKLNWHNFVLEKFDVLQNPGYVLGWVFEIKFHCGL